MHIIKKERLPNIRLKESIIKGEGKTNSSNLGCIYFLTITDTKP